MKQHIFIQQNVVRECAIVFVKRITYSFFAQKSICNIFNNIFKVLGGLNRLTVFAECLGKHKYFRG